MFIYVLLLSLGDTSAGTLFVPHDIIRPVVSAALAIAYGLFYIFNWRYNTLIMFNVSLAH